MNEKKIGKELIGWSKLVHGKVDSGFYPEEPFYIQLLLYYIQMFEEDFWKGFKSIICHTYRLIDEEPTVHNDPALDEKRKKELMSADILILALKGCQEKKPGIKTLISLLEKDPFSSWEKFSKALDQI